MFRIGQLWRDVDGYEGLYQVSIYGEVFSTRSNLILKGSPIPSGYLTVALHKNGKQHTKSIHRLVAVAHIPNHEMKPSINHIDSNRTNNCAGNLEWCTPAENTQHGVTHGNIKGCPRALTDKQADQIRSRYWYSGHRMLDLADEYEVSKTTIKNVLRGTHYPMECGS